MGTDQGGPSSLSDDAWMIRPCNVYIDEYKECKSWKGRFHQYYIYGENKDCSKWKEDFDNCLKARNDNPSKVSKEAEAIVINERERRSIRLANAKNNDIWEYRNAPPEEWNKPLPEYLERMKLPSVDKSENIKSCTIL